MSKRIAVVILVWNNRKYLEEFLPSVIEYSSGLADIVIADNASTDDSVFYLEANFPSIRIIRNKTNEGFTGGYNTALRQVDNEYFVKDRYFPELVINLRKLMSKKSTNASTSKL